MKYNYICCMNINAQTLKYTYKCYSFFLLMANSINTVTLTRSCFKQYNRDNSFFL